MTPDPLAETSLPEAPALDNVQQLPLFADTAAGGDELEYTYRVARNGDFVVTGTVPGYGRVTTRNRFLFPAVTEFRARAEAARAAVRPLF